MNYTAIIYDEAGAPIVRLAVTSLSTQRRSLAPLRLPDRWGVSSTFSTPEDPEHIDMSGYILARLAGNWSPPSVEPERQITVPD